MARGNYNDLLAFVAVAREGSFTRAAAQLGVSQSALSHTMRALEASLGVRLLTRTTRSVSTTEAGERLMATISPRFDEIEAELAALNLRKDKPVGTIRLTAAEHAANTVLWPKLIGLTTDYPEINVEIIVDYGRSGGKRYDRRSHWSGSQDGSGGCAQLPRWKAAAAIATGSRAAQVHQPATPNSWRANGVGVRA